MKLEVWRDIPGYKNYYQVSDEGRVRSLDRTVLTKRGERFYKGKIKECSDNEGYKLVTLSKNGKQRGFNVSALVAMAFLGHKPDGHQLVVDHINGVKTDNRAENLQIVTHRNNTSTCYRSDRNTLTSKFVGVYYHKQTDSWLSQVQLNSKKIYLGVFENEIDASNAYQKALAKINDGTFDPENYKAKFSSKYKGVTFHKTSQKWRARPSINGKQIYLGSFENEEKAFQMILLYESAQPIVKNKSSKN